MEQDQEPKGTGAVILCACGCGQRLREMDDRTRPRRYINGHYAKMIWRLYAEATAKGLDMTR